MAIIVSPGETFVACIQVHHGIVGTNKVVAELKDQNGTRYDRKDCTELDASMLWCAQFVAPQAEGLYYVDFFIADQSGSLVEELPDELVIVTSTTVEAIVKEIRDRIANNVEPKLNDIDSKVTSIQNTINEEVMNKLDMIGSMVLDIMKWVKIRKC